MKWPVLEYCLLAWFCGSLLWRLFALFRYRVQTFIQTENDNKEPSIDAPRVLIVVPLLREQENVPMLVRSLGDMHMGAGDRVVFVTTAREEKEKKDRAVLLQPLAEALSHPRSRHYITTRFAVLFSRSKLQQLHNELAGSARDAILERLQKEYCHYPTTSALLHTEIAALPADKSGRFHLLEYPHADGLMAHQINAAFDYARQQLHFDYICLLTADSFVGADFLQCFKHDCSVIAARTGARPPVVQALPVFSRNLHLLDRPVPEQVLLYGNAVFQSGFSVYNELVPMLITQQKLMRTGRLKADPFSIPSLIGHGCFIEKALFLQQGGFPTNGWCEDIILTLSYAAQGIPILPLNGAVERNEVPYTLKSLLRQLVMWAHTAIQVSLPGPRFLKAVRNGGGNTRAQALLLPLLKRWYLNFSWLAAPVLSLAFLIGGSYAVPLAALLNLLALLYAGHCLVRKNSGKKLSPAVVISGGVLFYWIVYPLGFLLALGTFIAAPFYRFAKPKTER